MNEELSLHTIILTSIFYTTRLKSLLTTHHRIGSTYCQSVIYEQSYAPPHPQRGIPVQESEIKVTEGSLSTYRFVSGLPLPCATAQQQSYIVHAITRASVVRPSVKPIFSETIKRINTKLWGKAACRLYLQTISFFNFFFTICFSFLLT